jgi:hypothetical protein
MNIMQAFQKTVRDRRYEPKERWCGGSFGPVAHRFPIKGGISWGEALVRFGGRNHLLDKVRVK